MELTYLPPRVRPIGGEDNRLTQQERWVNGRARFARYVTQQAERNYNRAYGAPSPFFGANNQDMARRGWLGSTILATVKSFFHRRTA